MKRAATEETNESGNETERERMRVLGSQEECDDQGAGAAGLQQRGC